MPNHELETTLAHVEAFCKANQIGLFYGKLEHSIGFEMIWDSETPGLQQLERALSIAKEAGIRLLNIQREVNDLYIDEEMLQDCLEELEDEEARNELLSELAIVRQTDGQLKCLTLSFFYQGGLYTCTQSASWEPSYTYVDNIFYPNLEDDDDDESEADYDAWEKTAPEDIEDQPGAGVAKTTLHDSNPQEQQDNVKNRLPIQDLGQKDALSEETIEQEARKIIENEKYLRAKGKQDRRTAASQLLKKQGFEFIRDRWAIEEKAEELYQDEVVPRQEQAIIEKIKAYLASTKKPTVTGAARLLGMDVRRIGFFWEEAQKQ